MIYTTLNRIRKHSPCTQGWNQLLKHLGKTKPDDEPVGFDTILESNGLMDAIWCLRSVPEEKKRWKKLVCRFARHIEHLMKDPRSVAAVKAAEDYIEDLISLEELNQARTAAHTAYAAAAAVYADAAAADAAVYATHAAHAADDAAAVAAREQFLKEIQETTFLQILEEDIKP